MRSKPVVIALLVICAIVLVQSVTACSSTPYRNYYERAPETEPATIPPRPAAPRRMIFCVPNGPFTICY